MTLSNDTPLLDPYDAVPYDCRPKPRCHPDRFAIAAMREGVVVPPGGTYRLLELGCADGSNLLGMAARNPDATFVGVDRNARQVQRGWLAREQLALHNLRLDVADVDGLTVEPFDYIVAEGLLSWVAPSTRNAVLATIAAGLNEHGAAMLSYNTMPCWAIRGELRRVLVAHAPSTLPPRTRLERARQALRTLTALLPQKEPVGYAKLLASEAKLLLDTPDAYLLHDILELENHAFGHAEFLKMAAEHGLREVHDLAYDHDGAEGPRLRSALNERGFEGAAADAMLDLVRYRGLRCAVLTKQGPASPPGAAAVLARLHVRASVHPKSETPNLDEGEPETFETPSGSSLVERRSLGKAVLMTLLHAWPHTLDWDTLIKRATALLHENRVWNEEREATASERDRIAIDLLALRDAGLLGLHLTASELGSDDANRPPCASPLAVFEAQRQAWATSHDHGAMSLDPFDRQLIRLLDGKRPANAVMSALYTMLRDGRLTLRRGDRVLTDPKEIAEVLPPILQMKVTRLRANGLCSDLAQR